MIVALSQILVLGLALAMLLDRTPSRLRLLGLAFLLGSGGVWLVLLVLPRWSPVLVTATMLALTATFWALAWKRAPRLAPFQWPHGADLVTILLTAEHARYSRGWDGWDFWAIWGLKGRVFLANGGIDWSWLEHPWNAFSHSDYPLLLPLNYSFHAMHAGAWNEGRLGLVTTLFGAAAILFVRDAFERELGRSLAAWATLGVASLALSPWVGYAEAPFIAYGTAGLLCVRNGDLRLGSVLLGLAACTKNEGLTLVVAAAGALVLAKRWRDVPRLWPAAAIAAPWLILRAVHALPTYLMTGPLQERMFGSVERLPHLLGLLARERPLQPELWIALLVGVLVFASDLRRERFVLTAVTLQVAFYVGAFLITPLDLEWQVQTAAARLLEQMALPLASVILLIAGRRWRSKPDGHSAAARI